MASGEHMELRGTLAGHNGWVTQIATTQEVPDMILSASRGAFHIPPLPFLPLLPPSRATPVLHFGPAQSHRG